MRTVVTVAACSLVMVLTVVCSGNRELPAAAMAAPIGPPIAQTLGMPWRLHPAAPRQKTPLRATNNAYTLLYAFAGTPDGASPLSGLAVMNGTLYGTTLNGSTNYCSMSCGGNDCYLGCGTVFSVSGKGAENVIYDFKGNFNNAGDGAWPFASLLAVGGTFYGTTGGGGGPGDHGTFFSVTPSGQERLLYSFQGGNDAGFPEASLVEMNGLLYGTSVTGGGSGCGGGGCGTVFSITPSGSEHVLYRFKGGNDGARVYAGVTPFHGKLYGATLQGGGSGCGGGGCGTIYSIDSAGKERVLYRFGGTTDGAFPNGLTPLHGTLYGTTEGGGSRSSGTFFSITRSGKLTTLYNFADIPDGNLPGANLIAVDGTFYSTTVGGGTQGVGTVFSIAPSGTETVLYSFLGGNDGWDPQAPLVAKRHALYGTTYRGGGTGCGGNGCGTIFRVRI